MKKGGVQPSITYRDGAMLDKYLREIGKVPLLTIEEEIELAEKVKTGDRTAVEKLTKANLRFVVSIAKQYQNQGLTLHELICEGNFGLTKAAYKFDPTKGFKFITCAVWWIRQSIVFALAESPRMIRLPQNKVGLIVRVNKAFNKIEQMHQRDPFVNELAEELDLSEDKIYDAFEIANCPISFDKVISEDTSMLDILKIDSTTDEGLMNDSLSYEINNLLLNNLSAKKSKIIRMYFGIGCDEMTIGEIAYDLGLKRERVRQIRDEAILRLRKIHDVNKFKKFFV